MSPAIFPLILALPFVGDAILERIFNNVVFPAPLLPINPTLSPLFISIFILLRARIRSELL